LNDPANFSSSTHKDLKSRLLRLGTAVAFQVAAKEDLQILRAMMPTFELNQDERTSASSKMKLWKDAAGRIGNALLEDRVKQGKDLHPVPETTTTTTTTPANPRRGRERERERERERRRCPLGSTTSWLSSQLRLCIAISSPQSPSGITWNPSAGACSLCLCWY
jgi:hypothetical protein